MAINTDAFRGYSAALDELEDHQLAKTSELIWSCRNGELSVCWVTEDLDTFIAVLGGSAPEVITNSQSSRYFVDLESLIAEQVRLYIDSPEDDEVLIGYYFADLSPSAAPTQYKLYKRLTKTSLSVERYTPGGDLMSTEGELQTDVKADWTGPTGILDICEAHPGSVRILKKTTKDQSYLRLTGF